MPRGELIAQTLRRLRFDEKPRHLGAARPFDEGIHRRCGCRRRTTGDVSLAGRPDRANLDAGHRAPLEAHPLDGPARASLYLAPRPRLQQWCGRSSLLELGIPPGSVAHHPGPGSVTSAGSRWPMSLEPSMIIRPSRFSTTEIDAFWILKGNNPWLGRPTTRCRATWITPPCVTTTTSPWVCRSKIASSAAATRLTKGSAPSPPGTTSQSGS